MQPGDAVLFERGGYFAGQILINVSGSENSPIIFGAYGEGRSPIISGAIPIKNWSVYKNNIYKAEADTLVKNLFVNGVQKTLARYPNTGFLTIKQPYPNPKNGFADDKLNQNKDYWKGSNVRMRTINWAYEHTPVKSFVNGNITFEIPAYYPVMAGYGYYLDNNLNELDMENEWYFGKGSKSSNGITFYFPPKGMNPDNMIIEGSVFSSGFLSYKSLTNVVIKDLSIVNQCEYGVNFTGQKSKIRIENCTFSGQLLAGINLINNSEDCVITNCRFYDINGKALYLLNFSNSEISYNIFNKTGMIPGYGSTGDAFGMSAMVLLLSNSNHIFENNINFTGHDGINCIGKGNIIEKNIITNSMLLLNDGGAIKSYGQNTDNSIWKNNFAVNVPGNLEATNLKYNNIITSGIYLDDLCNNMKIVENTAVNCGMAGVYLNHNIKNITISRNVCYNNPSGIYFLIQNNAMSGNFITGNTFFGLNSDQVSVFIHSDKGIYVPGRFDSNYYANPYNQALFNFQSGSEITGESFNGFKKQIGNNSDVQSKNISGEELKYSKLFSNMTGDTSVVVLNPGSSYFDVELKSIYGSLTLLPYTSKVVISDKSMDNYGEINIAGGPLKFGHIEDDSFSDLKWYKVFGEDLKEKVVINAPKGFLISLSDYSSFNKTLTLNPAAGKIENIIFVRFDPDDDKSYYDFITNTSGNIVSKVKVSASSR